MIMHNRHAEEVFNQKYAQYADLLYRIAFLQLGSQSDAEDALQEVFIKLLYKAPPFRDAQHEKAWLIRVTQNKCRDLRRAHAFRQPSLEEARLADTMSAEETGDTLSVRAAVLSLPPNYKTVVLLYYYEGYSVSEIAEILRLSPSAVKMRLQRSREFLKLELEEQL